MDVTFEVLAIGEHSMVTKMKYKDGDRVPPHHHANEQSGYVISDEYRLKFGGYDEILQNGDIYSIPRNMEHSLEVVEEGEVFDFFTPVREDYL